MKKDIIRREAIKLIHQGKKYPIVCLLLEERFGHKVSPKTIRRWFIRFQSEDWNFKDNSTRPKRVHYKFNSNEFREIIRIRKMTGWDSKRIKKILEQKEIFMSKSHIEKVIRQANLQRYSAMKGIKLKWIRWQRKHPNTLWQLDGSGDENHGWILPVIDDCSRYCLGIAVIKDMTTKAVTSFLEKLFENHGKPRELLTDNGPEYRNEFDRWCEKHEIKHIRSAIHKPTTVGKVERFHQTIDKELSYCNNDLEYFRYRYNHIRPHWSLDLLTPADVYFAFHKLF